MGKRRKARELFVQALYAAEVGGTDLRVSIQEQIDRRNPSQRTVEYVQQLQDLFDRMGGSLDPAIDGALAGWAPDRVGAVERAILRLAVLELRGVDEVPAGVVMNEALELTRTFSTEDATRFVNGVLDRVLHDDTLDSSST